MAQTLNYLPEELEKITVWCEGCKAYTSPPWLEKRPPTERVIAHDGGQWVPSSALFKCPTCQAELLLPVPHVQQTGGYTFFGDEAHRETEKLWLTTYSLVGTLNRDLHVLVDKVEQLKRRMEPGREPSSWKIHMKQLWSSDVRKADPIFKEWGPEKVQTMCDELFSLISIYGSELMVVNAASIFYLPENRKELRKATDCVRNQVYLALVHQVIDMATKCGVRPKFVFDGDVKRDDGTFTQPWAADVFNGGKLNLVYPFLARGMLIEEPEVVEPGSRPGLELADFVSFVIARYLHRRLRGECLDLDPRRLGKVQYIGFTASGDMIRRHKDRYPWGEFFGDA